MKLITFLCCCLFLFKGYAQEQFESKYFEADESGIMVLNDSFYEAIYADELELTDELKVQVHTIIDDHKEQRNFLHLSLKTRVLLQEQIITLYSALGEYSISDAEEVVLYNMVVKEDMPYQLLHHFRFHNLILSLISSNNRKGDYERSRQYIERHLSFLEQP